MCLLVFFPGNGGSGQCGCLQEFGCGSVLIRCRFFAAAVRRVQTETPRFLFGHSVSGHSPNIKTWRKET